MNDLLKSLFSHFLLPVIVPLVVGLGSAVLSAQVMLGKLDARVSTVEQISPRVEKLESVLPQMELRIGRNERTLERDFHRHEQNLSGMATKVDDHDKRITKLETLSSQTREMLSEVRADVKSLLRAVQGHK